MPCNRSKKKRVLTKTGIRTKNVYGNGTNLGNRQTRAKIR